MKFTGELDAQVPLHIPPDRKLPPADFLLQLPGIYAIHLKILVSNWLNRRSKRQSFTVGAFKAAYLPCRPPLKHTIMIPQTKEEGDA